MVSTNLAKNVIVTGASSGIGRDIALLFCRNGANVLAVARSLERLTELEKECQNCAGKIVICPIDLKAENAASEIINKAIMSFGDIDILVNNAGIGFEKPFDAQEVSQINSVVQTNLLAPMYLTKAVLPVFFAKREGIIIFVTSLAGKIGFPNLAPYSASKFGLEGFAETLREELKNTNIKVTVLRPGVTDTEFFEKAGMREYKKIVKLKKRIYPPRKVSIALLSNIENIPEELTIGSDRLFLRLLPFVPYRYRFSLLKIVNTLT